MLSGNSNWSHRYQRPIAVVQPDLLVFRFAPGTSVLDSRGTIAMQAASGAPGVVRCAVFPSCRLVIVSAIESADPWAPDLKRYRADEWRYCIFRDMILADARRLRPKPTILDIGCGAGFDGDVPLQRSIADVAECDIGVEADPEILVALLGWLSLRFKIPVPLLHIPFCFVISNLAALWGFLRYLRGERKITWTTVR